MSDPKLAADEADKEPPRRIGDVVKSEAMEWFRLLRVFIPVLFIFSMIGFEQRVIPSESMVPNLQVGDRVLVNKYSYGFSRFSVPWGMDRILPLGEGRMFVKEPERGDVIVFMHPHFRRVMIKRLIGVPGDRVQMRDEKLYLNDAPVEVEFIRDLSYFEHKGRFPQAAREYLETLGGKSFLTHQWDRQRQGDNTVTFVVPEGHYFFMGDNRDNSTDARFESGHCPAIDGEISKAGCPPRPGVSLERASVGFVPFDHLIGKGVTVGWTTKRCRPDPGITCPPKRVWKGL